MRTTVFAVSMLLAATLFALPQAREDTKKHGSAELDAFATRREFSKGGIGLVNKHLYVVVKSDKNGRNELVVKPTEETEERWKGKSMAETEVAIVYEDKVWSPEALPNRFDLSKAVIVSFEGSKIRFFDFKIMAGGYYERIGS
jgi:hypothetical protein